MILENLRCLLPVDGFILEFGKCLCSPLTIILRLSELVLLFWVLKLILGAPALLSLCESHFFELLWLGKRDLLVKGSALFNFFDALFSIFNHTLFVPCNNSFAVLIVYFHLLIRR